MNGATTIAELATNGRDVDMAWLLGSLAVFLTVLMLYPILSVIDEEHKESDARQKELREKRKELDRRIWLNSPEYKEQKMKLIRKHLIDKGATSIEELAAMDDREIHEELLKHYLILHCKGTDSKEFLCKNFLLPKSHISFLIPTNGEL